MKEIFAPVTTKGQVTIPAEIRRILGVKPLEKVSFTVERGQVCLRASGSVARRTAGMLKSTEPPLSAEELQQVAERAIAQDVVERTEEK